MVPLSKAFPEIVPPASLALLRLDARSARTLQEQMLEQLRHRILDQTLRPGQRLPSTRLLAEQLSVSRNTVLAVFEQLTSEGYLESTKGSGTYISRELPDTLLRNAALSAPSSEAKPELSPPNALVVTPFRPCIPSVAEFPLDVWERLRRRVLDRRGIRLLNYNSPAGDENLREQIATYLRDYRGVRCDPKQVLITSGAQQAFGIIGRVLSALSKTIWFEDPGYIDARHAFEVAGLTIVPQAIDHEGLTIPSWRAGAPQIVYTTPSRQFPLGTTMSLARRMEWLRFAAQHDIWMIEDDYDSEFRYEGRPLPSLQGLLPKTPVLYVGTFSKSLYPSLRIGYVVVPPRHLPTFWEAKEIADIHTPAIDQAILAEFMREGHFVRHLRKMRTLYAERARTFITSVENEWRGMVRLSPLVAGLNVVGWIERGREIDYARAAAERGFQALSLSRYAVDAKLPPGLFFGFSAFSSAQIRRAVRELGEAWKTL